MDIIKKLVLTGTLFYERIQSFSNKLMLPSQVLLVSFYKTGHTRVFFLSARTPSYKGSGLTMN